MEQKGRGFFASVYDAVNLYMETSYNAGIVPKQTKQELSETVVGYIIYRLSKLRHTSPWALLQGMTFRFLLQFSN